MTKETPNLTAFKDQLLKVVARAYAEFPASITVTTDDMSEDGIKWLLREGLIHGEVGGGLNRFFLSGATLSGHARRILETVETNAGGETLGQLAANTVAGSSERDHRVVADLVNRRLLGG